MIDLRLLREQPEQTIANLRRRAPSAEAAARAYLEAYDASPAQAPLDDLRGQLARGSAEVPALAGEARDARIAELRVLSSRIREAERARTPAQAELERLGREIPNLIAADVPDGASPGDNAVLRSFGEPRPRDERSDYLRVAEALGMIDIPRASKVSGARFGYLTGAGAELEVALVQFALRTLIPEKFTPVVPPVMVSSESMRAMGYLGGGGESETYHFPEDDLYLIGTSEQSLGPMHRDEALPAATLPKRYLGMSTCFRREAGSYGKDTRGILRVHQFDKLEMVSFTTPEQSEAEQDFLVQQQERLYQALGLPYRLVKLCTADLTSYPSARTIDIECWMPSEGRYREVGSCSTTTDYQTRDLNTHVAGSPSRLAHLLNGTAVAIGRTIIMLIENYSQSDGSLRIPDVLVPFMPSGREVIRPTR